MVTRLIFASWTIIQVVHNLILPELTVLELKVTWFKVFASLYLIFKMKYLGFLAKTMFGMLE